MRKPIVTYKAKPKLSSNDCKLRWGIAAKSEYNKAPSMLCASTMGKHLTPSQVKDGRVKLRLKY